MQIYESCTGNIYIAEDGYSPERCGFCGDTDNYLGSYRKGNLKSIGETLIELMLEYDSEYVKEIYKEICTEEKITEIQKKDRNNFWIVGGKTMNELQILGNENIMTSLEISEITGKRHDQILRDIRDEIEKLEKQGIGAEHIFVLGEYLDKNNQKRPMYSLTKEGVLQLAARYDAVVRFKLIEKATKPREYTQKELLLMQLESIEKIEKLQLENKQQAQQLIEQAPKVEFYNDVTESKTATDIGTVSKLLNFKNVGRNTLFDILRKQGILQSNNIPYQKYVDNGYFRVIESKWNDYVTGDVKISFKTVVYQKGIEYIAKILRELGYQKIEVA